MTTVDENVLFVKPSKEEEDKVFQEICMTREKLEEKVNLMKEWIQSQPHLPQKIGGPEIKPFLVWAKGDLTEAQKRLDSFYSMRTYNRKLFSPRDPLGDDFKDSITCSNVVVLPQLYKGYSVLMARPTSEHPASFTIEGLVRRATLILELSRRFRPLDRGLYVILDEKLANISYVTKLSPAVLKKFLHCFQNVMPVRVKEIVIINVNSVIRIILQTFVFPFLKTKLMKKVHIYSEGYEVLLNHLSKEILPSDYGGEQKILQQLDDDLNSYLIAKRELILIEDSLRTDESLRIGKGPFSESSNCSVM